MVLILLVTDIFSSVAIQYYMIIYSIDNMQKLLKFWDFYVYQASVAFMDDGVCVIGH